MDFLSRSGQGYWQILPIGPTGFGDSPYQPLSAFAGNPYFISLEGLEKDGFLDRETLDSIQWGSNLEKVDYGVMFENRFKVLEKAYDAFQKAVLQEEKKEKTAEKTDAKEQKASEISGLCKEFEEFKKRESYWLKDYALFMAIKEDQNGASWLTWEKDLKKREKKALEEIQKKLHHRMDFYSFLQFYFDKQYRALREYAKEKNVRIIGDLPFYVSLDSADAWSHPEVFQMDKDLTPVAVAGCPPDAFSEDGQLWGNPLYDWESLKKGGFGWWVERFRRNYELFDVIRIDHFHGFSDYYAIPYGEETARKGKLKEGPGIAFFKEMEKRLGKLEIIAEDLGNNTPENEALLKETGFPGMKVLQYGFTSWDSYYVNHKHVKNCVVYTGTHDNTPSMAWIQEINDGQRAFARDYINSKNTDYGAFVWDFIREAYRSVADLCIIPLQDYLCKGKEARLNTPGTQGENWQWRLTPNFLSRELEESIRRFAEIYGRI